MDITHAQTHTHTTQCEYPTMSVQPTTQIQNPTNLEWFTGELDSRQEFRNGTVTLDPDPKRFGAYHPIENGVTHSEIVCGFERCTTQLKHNRSYRNHLRKVHGFTFSTFVPTRAASVPAPAAPSSDVAVSALLGLAAQPRAAVRRVDRKG